MTKEFLKMASLFFDEASGKFSYYPEITKIDEIISNAQNQGTFYYVLSALKRLSKDNIIKLDDQTSQKISNTLLSFIMSNTLKYQEFKKLIDIFNSENINYCVLKGEAFSDIYHSPALRASTDIDILISEQDENKAIDILRSLGFKTEIRTESSNHSVCTHPILGTLELHIRLNYDFISEIWFMGEDNLKEPYIDKISENGYTFKAPSITDSYLITLFHAIKHFINDGLGIRNIADILFYLKKHKNEIDLERVNKILTKLKYKTFIDNILGVGILYFGFSQNDFPPVNYNKELCDIILEDIYKYGMFGSNKDKKKFYESYTEKRCMASGNQDFKKTMAKTRKNSIKSYSSFSKENLKKLYPYAKNSILLPFAFVNHIGSVTVKVFKKFTVIKQALGLKSKKSYEKGEIIQKFDMI